MMYTDPTGFVVECAQGGTLADSEQRGTQCTPTGVAGDSHYAAEYAATLAYSQEISQTAAEYWAQEAAKEAAKLENVQRAQGGNIRTSGDVSFSPSTGIAVANTAAQARLDKIYDKYLAKDFQGVVRPKYDPTFTGERAFNRLDFSKAGQKEGVLMVIVGPKGLARSDTALATTLHHEYRGHVQAFLEGRHPPPGALRSTDVRFEAQLNRSDAAFARSIGDGAEYQYRMNNYDAAMRLYQNLINQGL
jgi:hypothetical protein